MRTTCRAATLAGVPTYGSRGFALGNQCRAFAGTLLLGASSVVAVTAIGGAATLTAAWLIAGTLGRNPDLRLSAPVALQVGLPRPLTRLTDGEENFAVKFAALSEPVVEGPGQAALAPAAAPPVAIAPLSVPLPVPRKRIAEQVDRIPLPAPRPLQHAPVVTASMTRFRPTVEVAQATARAEILQIAVNPAEPNPEVTGSIARHESKPPAPLPTPVPAVPIAPSPIAPAPAGPAVAERRAGPRLAYADPKSLLSPENHTAIYDIAAHTVYLPSGRRLEAHSGLGRFLDDPRFITQKARGPTPPNVYRLTLREQLFHGVRAIRLNPEDDHKMYGRDGILAHTYMLGPTGQSFGCVSFRNYPEFLNAFLRGEVDRLVVVPHLESPPSYARA